MEEGAEYDTLRMIAAQLFIQDGTEYYDALHYDLLEMWRRQIKEENDQLAQHIADIQEWICNPGYRGRGAEAIVERLLDYC